MPSFEDRKNAVEAKFAQDAALKFKVEARRNKLLGQWAADLFGYSGDKEEAYIKSVIMADLEEQGDEDVFRKLRKDFDDSSVEQTDEQIRQQMDEKLFEATEQVEADG